MKIPLSECCDCLYLGRGNCRADAMPAPAVGFAKSSSYAVRRERS
jgi:hypothetical protein